MSIIFKRTVNTEYHHNFLFNIEKFDTAFEVADTCESRTMTDSRFDDVRTKSYDGFEGVKNYEETIRLLKYGYQPTVDKMKDVFKRVKTGDTSRYKFKNEIVGEVPLVPLALKGIPNNMLSVKMTPIKEKVIDLYYDLTCSCITRSSDIITAGQKLLSTIIEMEKQGYRFNLYSVQSYLDCADSDMMIVKIKSSSQSLNLRRVSFPLTHTAFFRVIGFDWYSKFPKGKFRFGYGTQIEHEFNEEEIKEFTPQLFGKNAVYIPATTIIKADDPEKFIKERINGNSKT